MPENALGVFDTGTISTAYFATAVTRGQRVTLTLPPSGQGAPTATVADATTPGQGVADVDITPVAGNAMSYYGPVREYNNGSFPCICATAVASGDKLFPAAAGAVSNVSVGGNTAFAVPLRTGAIGDIINARPQLV